MPWIRDFRATSILKAFILNSIAATLVIFIAITVKSELDTWQDVKPGDSAHPDELERKSSWRSAVITLTVTFLTSMAAYALMYWVFGFGGGMLVHS